MFKGRIEANENLRRFFFYMFNYMFKRRIETNDNRHRAEELVTLLDEPYLALLFNCLPSPPSSPAVGAMSVFVTVVYIAAVVDFFFFF
jgi:H2-forming N5,N10-methylenetetrahydromethanopterin dehydrogenase-like enzyme